MPPGAGRAARGPPALISRARRALALGLRALLPGWATSAADLTIATTAPSGAVERIPAIVSRPEGAGPFPAVVIMHDGSRLGPRPSSTSGRWARELLLSGHIAGILRVFTGDSGQLTASFSGS